MRQGQHNVTLGKAAANRRNFAYCRGEVSASPPIFRPRSSKRHKLAAGAKPQTGSFGALNVGSEAYRLCVDSGEDLDYLVAADGLTSRPKSAVPMGRGFLLQKGSPFSRQTMDNPDKEAHHNQTVLDPGKLTNSVRSG